MEDPLEIFRGIDIYVFDQLLRGRITPEMRVLDAGCGGGRNIRYLMARGAEVFGLDQNPEAIARVKTLAAETAPVLPTSNFSVGEVADTGFPDEHFDAVICSAVLHFADSLSEWCEMVDELWRVLRPGGVLFTRLATTITMKHHLPANGDDWYQLPDGTQRFLVSERTLISTTARLNGILLDPIKTTNVQNSRAMTTWVLAKGMP